MVSRASRSYEASFLRVFIFAILPIICSLSRLDFGDDNFPLGVYSSESTPGMSICNPETLHPLLHRPMYAVRVVYLLSMCDVYRDSVIVLGMSVFYLCIH
ncbi:hypothetical protein F5Y12DRAFT_729004 [Xylaria sp. FL1777]|nr:hypothetical protein F5Y12DRAFT_729004 [Xylaria sp. FL1777]